MCGGLFAIGNKMNATVGEYDQEGFRQLEKERLGCDEYIVYLCLLGYTCKALVPR